MKSDDSSLNKTGQVLGSRCNYDGIPGDKGRSGDFSYAGTGRMGQEKKKAPEAPTPNTPPEGTRTRESKKSSAKLTKGRSLSRRRREGGGEGSR